MLKNISKTFLLMFHNKNIDLAHIILNVHKSIFII
jgi:hypothetical protein